MSRSYKVEFASVARRDLETILEFIATDDPVAAVGVLDAIESRVKWLEKMPQRGRVVPNWQRLESIPTVNWSSLHGESSIG